MGLGLGSLVAFFGGVGLRWGFGWVLVGLNMGWVAGWVAFCRALRVGLVRFGLGRVGLEEAPAIATAKVGDYLPRWLRSIPLAF